MRKQYHFRRSAHGYFAWDVDRLVHAASRLPKREVRLAEIRELDQPFRLEGLDDCPTYRQVAEHGRLIEEADLSFPIIMSSDGRVMDGMHRVMKALNAEMTTIGAVVFERDPEPDYIDVLPDQLPY